MLDRERLSPFFIERQGKSIAKDYRRWSWLGHVLRMPEHRLVRQVLLNCVKPTHETLFADVPNISIENATKMSKDRKLWSGNKPHCVANLYQGEL